MFRKLRNKLIFINLGITTAVILVTFTAIYIVSTNFANRRPPMPEDKNEIYSTDLENLVEISIRSEKQASARVLLIILIVSGCAIEVIVALVSYFLAEEAIKPVRDTYEAQKIFIANASHEIKTPLAAIEANLEAADIHGNHWIDNVGREAHKLAKLNGELLTLARLDMSSQLTSEEVVLGDLISDTVRSFEPRLKKVKFSQKIQASGRVKIDRASFCQILSILLDNAIKYSAQSIRLNVTEHKLTISNDGAKITDKDLPHIFDRFYQADKSAEGVGLGLAIAKSLAERNGWRLLASNDKQTTFTLIY